MTLAALRTTGSNRMILAGNQWGFPHLWHGNSPDVQVRCANYDTLRTMIC